MQYLMKHGETTIKCGTKSFVPSIQYDDRPILAIRTYIAPQTGVINLSYYYQHGAHRCNILQDSELGSAVYCYLDIAAALKLIDVSEILVSSTGKQGSFLMWT